MSIFTYTATRELAPGTTDQDVVSRDFRLLTRRLTRRPNVRQNTSLSGAVESLLLRTEKHYSCQTPLLEPFGLPEAHFLEFFASVENAEVFVFDREGSIAQPGPAVSCVMVSKIMNTTEKGKAFNQYAFVIREA